MGNLFSCFISKKNVHPMEEKKDEAFDKLLEENGIVIVSIKSKEEIDEKKKKEKQKKEDKMLAKIQREIDIPIETQLTDFASAIKMFANRVDTRVSSHRGHYLGDVEVDTDGLYNPSKYRKFADKFHPKCEDCLKKSGYTFTTENRSGYVKYTIKNI